MPRRKPAHSQTDLQAGWKLMTKMGKEPNAIRFHIDGSLRLLCIDPAALTVMTDVAASGEAENYWNKVLNDGSA